MMTGYSNDGSEWAQISENEWIQIGAGHYHEKIDSSGKFWDKIYKWSLGVHDKITETRIDFIRLSKDVFAITKESKPEKFMHRSGFVEQGAPNYEYRRGFKAIDRTFIYTWHTVFPEKKIKMEGDISFYMDYNAGNMF